MDEKKSIKTYKRLFIVVSIILVGVLCLQGIYWVKQREQTANAVNMEQTADTANTEQTADTMNTGQEALPAESRCNLSREGYKNVNFIEGNKFGMFMNSLLSFEDFAAAFSLDYECVFFVDVATGNYSMYAFRGGHKNLELTETSDFWADTKVNLEAFVFKEDKKSFAEVVNKDFLLKAVQHDSVFKFKYRLQMGEEVVWFQMKVILGHSQCRDYLVIGVNNIDQQERERLDLEHRASKSRIYGQIVMALAERYDALYMVNVETGHFAQ